MPRGETWPILVAPRLRSCFNPLPALPRGETPAPLDDRWHVAGFNPLPALPRGETWKPSPTSALATCFNPLPALPRGETLVGLANNQRQRVSIRSPRCRGEKRCPDDRAAQLPRVSIRSPRCRGEKPHFQPGNRHWKKFQSAPRVAAGRNTLIVGQEHDRLVVSIRSPRCRGEKPARAPSSVKVVGVFQSAPRVAAGRNMRTAAYPWRISGFNPLPALPRGETTGLQPVATAYQVSIRSPRCRGEKQRRFVARDRQHRFQSAPRVAAGRNAPLASRCRQRCCMAIIAKVGAPVQECIANELSRKLQPMPGPSLATIAKRPEEPQHSWFAERTSDAVRGPSAIKE